jgi:DNA-binding MarR family transcriptional regulator
MRTSCRGVARWDELAGVCGARAAVRSVQSATARYDPAVADAIGVNRTDPRLIDLLERAGRLTARQLAAATDLTIGAITTAIDRLERSGYARRARDAGARRRIYVEPTDTAKALGRPTRFVRNVREFNEQKAAELEAELEQRQKHGSST